MSLIARAFINYALFVSSTKARRGHTQDTESREVDRKGDEDRSEAANEDDFEDLSEDGTSDEISYEDDGERAAWIWEASGYDKPSTCEKMMRLIVHNSCMEDHVEFVKALRDAGMWANYWRHYRRHSLRAYDLLLTAIRHGSIEVVKVSLLSLY